MLSRVSLFSLILANVLIPFAILIFAAGFFPYKPFLAGLAEYESAQDGMAYTPPEAPFDKVIFMVVDALRSDFVYSESSGFSFTQGLIANGAALPFTAHATSPTITMPRIKAITTGSTPSFVDLILNFAESDTSSTLAAQDTWLAQMKAKNSGKLVMYGDDTWLKLFPETFDRADGTSSFFVSDFTEVDNNVTRHVPEELKNDDWNTMVLHYLGLDHIGHKAGPRSPNMIPKQKEMDGIVKQIYDAMTSSDHLSSTLLVLCGDHGMNDAGNHGGSAPGETSPALVFVSPKLKALNSGYKSPATFKEDFQYYQTVEQSDIAPTLGGLLGFPVPRNNLGSFIPRFLDFWPQAEDKERILLQNARQILHVVRATFPNFEGEGPSENCGALTTDVEELACKWRSMRTIQRSGSAGFDKQLLELSEWIKQAGKIMSSTASNYDVSKLVIGQIIAALALVLGIAAAGPIVAKFPLSSAPFLAFTLFYGIMMFASSYVEEEQHFWYWTSTAWLLLLWFKGNRKRTLNSQLLALSSVIILIAMRLARRWNQTGQKLAGSPDIARTFFSEHTNILWTLVAATYLWNLNSLVNITFSRFGQLIAGAVGTTLTTAALTFKLAFTNEDSPELLSGLMKSLADTDVGIALVPRARIVFWGLLASTVYTVVAGFSSKKRPNPTLRSIHDLLTLFLITQSRATNIPLLLLFTIQSILLSDLDLSPIEITTTSLLLQHASFFAFGNSNAISSIDLSSAYNGISGYNVLAVGILTFVSNWTGPIFWASATTLLLLQCRRRGDKAVLFQHLAMLTLFVTTALLFVMVACTILRTHLFIWTVFSPKYLYSMAWTLGQHLGINVGVCSLLYWLGTKYQ